MHTPPQRVIVIHSPHSGRSGQLSQALASLQQQGVVVADTISIASLDPLPPQGATWKERGIDVALAAGGDGTVINAPIFAGRWNLALPEAHMSDRLLDIVVMEDIGIRHDDLWVADVSAAHEPAKDTASNEQAQPSTHHPAELSHIPGMHHVQARGVTITTQADPRDATPDGEVRGQTPMYVHVAHERLQILVPR